MSFQSSQSLHSAQVRKLKQKEIKDILNGIEIPKSFPPIIQNKLRETIFSSILSQLKKVKINPSIFEEFKNEICRKYNSSFVDSGESIGIICAQSMSQMFTQSVLNTFHVAGIGADSVNIGLPRFTELTSTKSDTNSTTYIFFKDKIESSTDLRKRIKGRFACIHFKDIVLDKELVEKSPKNKAFDILFGCEYSKWCLKFKLDKKIMFNNNLSLYHIGKCIESTYFDLYAYFENFDSEYLYIHIESARFDEFSDKENIDILCEDFIFDVIIPALYKIQLCGIKNIEKVYPYKISEEEKWICIAKGSNLKEIYRESDIDTTKTISDKLWEIFELFGITATRKYLKEEFNRIISYDGTYISPAHIETLVGFMTYSGDLYSATRYGIKREQVGPLAKASFEESLFMLTEASQRTEIDNMKSASSNILMCQRGNFGTGYFDLFFRD